MRSDIMPGDILHRYQVLVTLGIFPVEGDVVEGEMGLVEHLLLDTVGEKSVFVPFGRVAGHGLAQNFPRLGKTAAAPEMRLVLRIGHPQQRHLQKPKINFSTGWPKIYECAI